jgi:SAM-dependent methyltransferase
MSKQRRGRFKDQDEDAVSKDNLSNGGRVDQHIKGVGTAPSLLRRLVSRSGAMTLEGLNAIVVDAAPASPRLARIVSLVQHNLRDGAVLDIGCWTGALAHALDGVVQCSYTGVDIEPAAQAVQAARAAMPDQRFLVVPSVESLPFDSESFDIVVLTEVIEHVPAGREGPLLAELARVLRPGGSIILSTPYHNILTPLDPAWFFGHRHYSIDQVASLARACGLTMTDVEFSGGVWTALDTNLFYLYKHVLHRPYVTYHWLYERTKREYGASSRSTLATNLWCRLVH